jgi:hypothetical protein
MKFRCLVREQPDLVDRQRLDPIVFPIVRVPVQRSLGQKCARQQPGCGRLAKTGLADEEVCVSKTPGAELRAQLIEGLDVPHHLREQKGGAPGSGSARPAAPRGDVPPQKRGAPGFGSARPAAPRGDVPPQIGHGVTVLPLLGAAAASRSMASRSARPCSQTSRMRCSAVKLVRIASRNTTA